VLTLALLLLGIVPHDDVARESVDLAELNHFYDEHGRLVFDQVIFYDWGPPYTGPITDDAQTRFVDESAPEPVKNENWRYQVRAWRLVKNPNLLPIRDWTTGGYRSIWQDGEQVRDIRAKSFRETWTQEDPELIERRFLPKEKRRELLPVKIKPKPVTGTGQVFVPTEEEMPCPAPGP
jgi:hypothetical protein